jgi:threonine/homoserine/homoserine lactone efflux protein
MFGVADVGVRDYWAFVVAVIVFLAIPGVGNLAIITSTSKGRIAGGLAAALGVIVADQVLMWLAVAGVSALLAANPGVFGLVQYTGALYLAYLGVRMILAKPGDAPVLDMKPRRFFQQAMLITLLNPKAIVFYMAFFPLFIDPVHHRGMLTFGVMAATVATLTFLYGLGAVLLTHFLAERMRANPLIGRVLQKVAGVFLIGFGVKLAVTR